MNILRSWSRAVLSLFSVLSPHPPIWLFIAQTRQDNANVPTLKQHDEKLCSCGKYLKCKEKRKKIAIRKVLSSLAHCNRSMQLLQRTQKKAKKKKFCVERGERIYINHKSLKISLCLSTDNKGRFVAKPSVAHHCRLPLQNVFSTFRFLFRLHKCIYFSHDFQIMFFLWRETVCTKITT